MVRPPLRVAIVGFGLAGRVFHGPLVAVQPDMRVAAVVTVHRVPRGRKESVSAR